jgi:hypothetical protein
MPIMTLTGVAINVSANQLTGTTTAMEYSLDSTNGTNGSWVTATSTNTSVTFDAGEVYVREIAAPGNFRVITTLSAAALAPSGIAVDVAAGHITGTASGQEYSLDNGDTWADASATTTAVVFTGGEDVIVRVKATSTTLASLATSLLSVATQELAPSGIAVNVQSKGSQIPFTMSGNAKSCTGFFEPAILMPCVK